MSVARTSCPQCGGRVRDARPGAVCPACERAVAGDGDGSGTARTADGAVDAQEDRSGPYRAGRAGAADTDGTSQGGRTASESETPDWQQFRSPRARDGYEERPTADRQEPQRRNGDRGSVSERDGPDTAAGADAEDPVEAVDTAASRSGEPWTHYWHTS